MIRCVCVGKKAASYANVRRAKLCAIAVTLSGRVVAVAHNRRTDGDKNRWTEHAEECLIRKIKRTKAIERFGKLILLVMRINTRGLVMAKPCARCQSMIAKLGNNITVYYTDNEGKITRL
jgi:cytidine deaminase